MDEDEKCPRCQVRPRFFRGWLGGAPSSGVLSYRLARAAARPLPERRSDDRPLRLRFDGRTGGPPGRCLNFLSGSTVLGRAFATRTTGQPS